MHLRHRDRSISAGKASMECCHQIKVHSSLYATVSRTKIIIPLITILSKVTAHAGEMQLLVCKYFEGCRVIT